ncbi:MAG: alpha/beta fold hydrolase [Gammaproteobacteria bacterium]|nr:alpha/beta fold hydrolase [Gammaproteobacteria bacterium]
MPEETVIFVHGIWTNGLEMSLLRRRLTNAGFRVIQFSYRSVRSTPIENAMDLQIFVEKINSPAVHYVCHSLGGLIIRHLFNEYPEQPPGRIVTMGTPHTPSSAARQLARFSPGRLILGLSTLQGLLGNVPPWRNSHDLGVIAGRLRLGMGMLIPGIPKPNDGTVAIEETKLEGMTDHITLPVSHFGMLVSARVAGQTINFLKHGAFLR